MNPAGNHIWMIGDNPINDIEGAKQNLNATTLQKTHAGTELGDQYAKPDASFAKFSALRSLIKNLQEK
jgi:FMN phosphatase YigB (HAD superfamily)